jgi:putative regulatory protein, FmdB family
MSEHSLTTARDVPEPPSPPSLHNTAHLPMPTYTYRRDDGTTFEAQQKITDDPLRECPETGQSVERIFTRSPGVVTDTASDDGPASSAAAGGSCCGPLCGL